MRFVSLLLCLLAAWGACCTAAAQPLSADTPSTTSSGATFVAPAGWTLRSAPSQVILEAPEADSRLAIVEVQADSAQAAVTAAWATFRPEFRRAPWNAMPQAPRNGWGERRYFDYETSPNERLVIYAQAWRAGAAWTVLIVEASRATHEKRNAALSLIQLSLRPAGYQREMFTGRKAHPLDAERIARLRDFVADGMARLDVPGVGLALIDGGRVVFEGGLGVRELGRRQPVDADTLFMAASNTKAMTTLLLAQLVGQGKLRWDQPVVEVMPGFRLGDAGITRQVLVKHLICACTGLPRQDLEWLFEFKRATPASTMRLIGTLQPTSKFGEAYQYSNLMATAAGYVGAAVIAPGRELGAAYDAAMRDRIFIPLGMKRTTFDFARVQRGNHARPHDQDLDGRQAVARMDINYSIVPVRPAGGVWTSARDLAKYVQMEMAGGTAADGRRLVPREDLLARAAPQVKMGEDVSYGMGLVADRRWGIPIVRHGGAMTGYRSDMIWLPEHGVGAVILTNSNSGGFLLAPFLRRLLEVLFDGRDEAAAMLSVSGEQMHIAMAKTRKEVTTPPDPAASARLAGRYRSTALGNLSVERSGGEVQFRFSGWRSQMGTRLNDDGSLSFITIDPGVDGFNFVVAEREGRRALILRDAQHEYAFMEDRR